MSMILRLQRQKAEIQMETRQFKQFAEEKMAHDQQDTPLKCTVNDIQGTLEVEKVITFISSFYY
ncbi:hypothetical protein FRX31_034344 [Thalictrum thalictroides]|uniref:GTD-binding domain-containing protein n=1 Tax=Thalictrum thalictroides TaxID=46969 RepID=A0A7J6UUD6_THATH|nr:hypothetical protein FRX31_034344 [Thalictrum thalictroides]